MKKIALFAIFLLALFLRFWQLGIVPPSLNADEIAIGYNAYSILQTGRDEYGTSFPLTFRSFDDYKMPVYVYVTVPSIKIFGYNDVAVRLPSALFGTLTVLMTYFLVMELMSYGVRNNESDVLRVTRYGLLKKKDQEQENSSPVTRNTLTIISLLSALLLAISPWHIQFSRSAYEANVALCLVIAGAFFLLKGIHKGIYFIIGMMMLALSIWTYHSSRVFVPLFLGGFFVLYWRDIWNKKIYVVISLCLTFFLLFPMLQLSLSKEGQMRAMGVSIFSNQGLPLRFIEWMGEDYKQKTIPSFVATVIHNRRLSYMPSIINGYLEHYNPNFFFSEIILDKYHAPGVGLLYLWELPFLLIGIYALLRTKNQEPASTRGDASSTRLDLAERAQGGPGTKLLLWWFLIAPLAAAPTEQLPHPVRTLVFLPVLQIFTAYGILTVIHWIKNLPAGRQGNKQKIFNQELGTRNQELLSSCLLFIVPCVMVCSFFYYLHQYYVHLPIDYSSAWQYGRKEVVASVLKHKSTYKKVVVSTSLDVPYIFFLYYLRYDPLQYQKEGGTVSGGFAEDRNAFDAYVFRPIKPCEIAKEKTLFVGKQYEVPKGATILDTIYYKDGKEAFYLFTEPVISPACVQETST